LSIRIGISFSIGIGISFSNSFRIRHCFRIGFTYNMLLKLTSESSFQQH
jgi:hypothetical protein